MQIAWNKFYLECSKVNCPENTSYGWEYVVLWMVLKSKALGRMVADDILFSSLLFFRENKTAVRVIRTAKPYFLWKVPNQSQTVVGCIFHLEPFGLKEMPTFCRLNVRQSTFSAIQSVTSLMSHTHACMHSYGHRSWSDIDITWSKVGAPTAWQTEIFPSRKKTSIKQCTFSKNI